MNSSARQRKTLRIIAASVLVAAVVGSCGNEIHIDVPGLPRIDIASTPLPRSDQGTAILIEVQQARLEIDPTVRDPITAVATCADLITYCYAPGARTLDACIAAIPSCATSRPWEETIPCCPGACRDAYRRERDAGTAAVTAYDHVYLTAPTCFPGVQTALAGGP